MMPPNQALPSQTAPTRRNDTGVAMGLVLVLMTVLLAAAGITVWGLRSETGSAANDRLSRQLFDCAEQGLALGKAYFSTTAIPINNFLSTDVCSGTPSLHCTTNDPPGPFRPLAGPVAGMAVPGYPNGTTPDNHVLRNRIDLGGQALEFVTAVYDNADEDPGTPGRPLPQDYTRDSDNTFVVWAQCRDLRSGQTREVAASIGLMGTPSTDYRGQAGLGFRNQGNAN